jgi:hypothetical protein
MKAFDDANFVDKVEAEAATLEDLRCISTQETTKAKQREEEDARWVSTRSAHTRSCSGRPLSSCQVSHRAHMPR